MGIILEHAETNPQYAEIRALEMIREAQEIIKIPSPKNVEAYHYNICTAITLLATARVARE